MAAALGDPAGRVLEITVAATGGGLTGRVFSRKARRSGQPSPANAGGSISSAARRGPKAVGVRIRLWLVVIAATPALIVAIIAVARDGSELDRKTRGTHTRDAALEPS